jgi:hypothetical protein
LRSFTPACFFMARPSEDWIDDLGCGQRMEGAKAEIASFPWFSRPGGPGLIRRLAGTDSSGVGRPARSERQAGDGLGYPLFVRRAFAGCLSG